MYCATSDVDNCGADTTTLIKGWNLPVLVHHMKDSQVLTDFVKLKLPPFSENVNLKDQEKKGQFQFPGLPDEIGTNHLDRQDKTSDFRFYDNPRFVTHIDDGAILALTEYYKKNLKESWTLLDLCSSWISHLPQEYKFNQVVGLGMNQKELEANKRLDKFHVHDLNKNPNMDMFPDNTFDAVLCTVSVDYLIKPVAIFQEVYRSLKPGGRFVVSFSNRMFPTKVIKAWGLTGDPTHIFMVTFYFQESSPWKQVDIWDVTDKNAEHTNPMYVLDAVK